MLPGEYPRVASFLGGPSERGERKRYYYVRRRGLPGVRIKAEPGTLEFDIIYGLAMHAKTLEEVNELRRRLHMQSKTRIDWSAADRFIAQAERAVMRRGLSQ